MKTFLLKFIIFLSSALLLLQLVSVIILLWSNPLSRHLSWFKVYERVLRSQKKIHSDTLYIGDSVGNQFFNFEQTPNSLTTNGAILMSGHYLLARKAVETNPNIKKIVLATVPNEICRNFERPGTYNNFLKPFYTYSNKKYFSPLLYKKLDKKPLSYLCIIESVKILPFSDIDFSDGSPEREELSDLAIEYLKKLKLLCDENHIELQIISLPVPDTWIEKTNNWEKLRKQIKKLHFEQLFGNYLDNIIYLDISCFKDKLHLNDRSLEEYKSKFKL